MKDRKSSIELEILGIKKSLNSFHLHMKNDTFTIRTDFNNIIEFYKKTQKKKFEKKNYFISKRWIYFLEVITDKGYKAKFEHIGDEISVPLGSNSIVPLLYYIYLMHV